MNSDFFSLLILSRFMICLTLDCYLFFQHFIVIYFFLLKVSASGSYSNDGWGKREMTSKLDLGRDLVYTLTSSLQGSEASHALSARLTTPHKDWNNVEIK